MLVLPWFADSLMLLTSFFAFGVAAQGVVAEDGVRGMGTKDGVQGGVNVLGGMGVWNGMGRGYAEWSRPFPTLHNIHNKSAMYL